MDGSASRVLIVSGPSGSGKSTLVQKLHGIPGLMFSVSSTTRPPRLTESPGKCYDFITEEEFKRRVELGEFLEYAQVFGRHWYGTPRKQLDDARRAGLDLVLTGPKNRFALGRIAALGAERELVADRNDKDVVKLKFRSTDEVSASELAEFLKSAGWA